MLSFKPAFSLSSINRLFSSSPLSAIKMVLSAYLSLLIFTSAILIPACASSSLAFHMMYSAYKLNKQGDLLTPLTYSFPNLEPVHCSMSNSNSCFLTCIQVSQEASKVVWYSHLFKIFHTLCDPYKGFSVVNEADVFPKFSCFFYVGNLISGSSAFSKSSLSI